MSAEFKFKPIPKEEKRALNKLFRDNPLLKEQMMATLFDDQEEVEKPEAFSNAPESLWIHAISFFLSKNKNAQKRLEKENWISWKM